MVNSLGFFVAAFGLFWMPHAKSERAGILWVTIVMSAMGFSRGGFSVNHMDIAPKFAGIVMGISNTAGTFSGAIGSNVTGWIFRSFGGSQNPFGWSVAFNLAALLGSLGALFFIRSAKGERLFE